MDARTSVLDALISLMAREGAAAVSVRNVASEAGVSPAAVQYWFRSKQDLLAAALDHVNQRMGRRLAGVDRTRGPHWVLRDLLLARFPLDDERRDDAAVWLAFTAAAVTDARLRALVADNDRQTLALLGEWLHAHRDGLGLTLPSSQVASLLLAVVDGFTLRALTLAEPAMVAAELEGWLEAFLGAGEEGVA